MLSITEFLSDHPVQLFDLHYLVAQQLLQILAVGLQIVVLE